MAKPVLQFTFRGVQYQLRPVYCKKDNCTKCPHGPYWYAVVKMGRGKPATRYMGKELTGDARKYHADNFAAIARGEL